MKSGGVRVSAQPGGYHEYQHGRARAHPHIRYGNIGHDWHYPMYQQHYRGNNFIMPNTHRDPLYYYMYNGSYSRY